MQGPGFRRIAALVVVLALSGATFGHEEPVPPSAPEGVLLAHHHGPHAPCPPGTEHHCLACALHSLFAPAPAAARLGTPRVAPGVWGTAERREGTFRRPPALGRAPPGLLLPA